MTNQTNDSTDKGVEPYVVGYKKPPKATQFKKGNTAQSRKRGTKAKKHEFPPPSSLDEMLAQAMLQPVDIKKSGKPSTVPLIEAIMQRLASSLATASIKEQMELIKYLGKTTAINDVLHSQKVAKEPYSLYTPELEAKFLEFDKEFLVGYVDPDEPYDESDEPLVNDLDEGSI
jgi:hypothetical protein